MNEWILLGVGLVLGGAAAWLAVNSKVSELRAHISQHRTTLETRDRQLNDLQQQVRSESEQKVAAKTKLDQVQISLEEQKNLLKGAREELSATFNSLASEALKSNNQAFLDLAKTTFETIQAQAKATWRRGKKPSTVW